MKTTERIFTTFMAITLAICAFIGGYAIWDQQSVYASAQNNSESSAAQQLAAYQSENDDVIAFLEMDNTNINYGIAQGADNFTYVNLDIDGKTWSFTGSLFLDYRNDRGFSDFNNVIYGHNMDNGMFGDLKKYADSSFFNQNRTGELTLDNKTYTVDVFAYFIADAYDNMVFDPTKAIENPQSYIDYVAARNGQYRDIGVTTSDRLLTLTTCYGSGTDRSILVCRLTENVQPTPTPTLAPTPTPTATPIVPTNTIVTMRVPVQKKLEGQTPSSTAAFTFQVTAADEVSKPYLPSISTITINGEGISSFSFAFSMPGQYQYRITEINTPDGYTPAPTGYTLTAYIKDDASSYILSSTLYADGAVAKSSIALFTNTYAPSPTGGNPTPTPTPPPFINPTPAVTPTDMIPGTGSLTISKTVNGDLGDKNKEFSFEVALSASGTFKYSGSKSGTIANGDVIKLKSGESITIAGLPVGTTYSVVEREANQDGYKTKMSGASGTISASGSTAAFVNSRGSKPTTGFEPGEMRFVLIGSCALLGFGLMVIFRIKQGRKGNLQD